MLEPVVVKQSTSRSILAMLASLAFSAFCFICVFLDFKELGGLLETISRTEVGTILAKAFFVFGGLFFGYAFFYYIKRAVKGKEVLIVNEKGIYDNSSQSAVGFIPWSDINRVYIDTMLNKTAASQEFIEVEVKNEDFYLQKKSKLIQRAMKLNKAQHHQMICITLNFTGVKPEDVMPQILKFFEQSKNDLPNNL